MSWRDGVSELPNSNELYDPLQGGTPCTPMYRGPAVAEFRDGYPSEINRRGVSCF
jgi:hypothetical protein